MNRRNLLNEQLKRIESMHKPALRLVDLGHLFLGINIYQPKRSKIMVSGILTIVLFLSCLVTGGELSFVIEHISEPFPNYDETMILVLQMSLGLCTMFHTYKNRKQVREMLHMAETAKVLQDLEIFELDINKKSDLSMEIGEILHDNWHLINRQVVIFFRIVLIPCVFYVIRPILSYIYDCHIVETGVCKLRLPFDLNLPHLKYGKHQIPSHYTTFIMLQIGPYFCGITVFDLTCVFIVLMVHEVALFKVLRCLLSYTTSAEHVPAHLRVEYLKSCVKLYKRISDYHVAVVSYYKNILLAIVLTSTFLLCMLMYKSSLGLGNDTSVLFKMSTYLLAILIQMSVLNFNAQNATNTAQAVSFDWYNCAWYNESIEFKRIVRMMLMFSNRTFALSVGGFTNLSLQLLMQILRTSLNFFLLLRNVNGNN